jgi:hypothetical protein
MEQSHGSQMAFCVPKKEPYGFPQPRKSMPRKIVFFLAGKPFELQSITMAAANSIRILLYKRVN